MLLDLLEFFRQGNWLWAVPLTLISVCFVSPWGKGIFAKDVDRKAWIDRLSEARGAVRYEAALTRGLDWVDEGLSPAEKRAGDSVGAVAWSAGLLKLTLVLAVVYPVLSMLLHWIFGGSLSLMGQEVLPKGPVAAQVFVVFQLVALGGLCVLIAPSKSELRRTLFGCAALILLLGGNVFGTRVIAGFPDAFTFTFAFTLAFAFAFAGEFLSDRRRSAVPWLLNLMLLFGGLQIAVVRFWQPTDLALASFTVFSLAFSPFSMRWRISPRSG